MRENGGCAAPRHEVQRQRQNRGGLRAVAVHSALCVEAFSLKARPISSAKRVNRVASSAFPSNAAVLPTIRTIAAYRTVFTSVTLRK